MNTTVKTGVGGVSWLTATSCSWLQPYESRFRGTVSESPPQRCSLNDVTSSKWRKCCHQLSLTPVGLNVAKAFMAKRILHETWNEHEMKYTWAKWGFKWHRIEYLDHCWKFPRVKFLQMGGFWCRTQSEEPKLPDRRLSLVQVETLWSGHMSALSPLRKAEHAWCRTHLSHTPSVPLQHSWLGQTWLGVGNGADKTCDLDTVSYVW